MQEPDRIHLRDYLREAEIGAFAQERGREQRLRFSITVALAFSVAEAGDDVDRILSYDVLVDAVEDALASRRHDLVESLAEDIAARILAHRAAASATVTVEKLDLGPGALGVTLTRMRGQAQQAQPVLNAIDIAVAGQGDADSATIIVPSAPGLPLPQGGDRLRMQWLALDQQALAVGDRLGLPVVDSRTEIEALIAGGQRLVWAPSRMARAAVGLSSAQPEDLAAWLGDLLGQRAGPQVPIR